jgi:gas vesicle protein
MEEVVMLSLWIGLCVGAAIGFVVAALLASARLGGEHGFPETRRRYRD